MDIRKYARLGKQTFNAALLSALTMHTVSAQSTLNISQVPLFVSQSADPLVMLTMSKDHQLYYKAYNDFSDLVGLTADSPPDGVADTTYVHHFDYYGYFDTDTCYSYNAGSGRFVPQSSANSDNYCDTVSGDWSGNFLNWIAMTRMDIIRKVLYGGYRSTDTGSLTVLERTYLPPDAHSYAKYYNGTDVGRLTPFGGSVTNSSGNPLDDGITFCNTTYDTSSFNSQNSTRPPLIRVARGNFSLWGANERRQCYWSEEENRSNANNPAVSGIDAHSSNPSRIGDGLGSLDYTARVEVCGSTLYGNENETCAVYPNGNRKPIGLLQTYSDGIQFGLLTGSYNRNISGGVVRKNISAITDEINSNDGTFTNVPGIIESINLLRIYGYRYNGGTYLSGSGDNCTFQLTDINEGDCTSWGNPISEMMLETIRYFAGQSPTSDFDTNDNNRISGLVNVSSWQDPLNSGNYCASLNTVVFNASVSSYDDDQLGGFSALPGAGTLSSLVDTIGTQEGISNSVFIGENGGGASDLKCSPKSLSALSNAKGICPEAPTLRGTYDVAGLSYYAYTNDLRPGLQDDQHLKTYAVALSPALPKINVDMGGGNTVTILPAYELDHPSRGIGAGTLVDFKIVEQTPTYGKFYVNWEDSEQGGDYDQDIWGLIEYQLVGAGPVYNQITITTDAIAESTVNDQGFGYVISGTTQDGFHVHSGIEGYDNDPDNDGFDDSGVLACNNCQVGNPATSHTYTVGNSTAQLIEQPLFYAAKYGGFNEEAANENDLPDIQAEWDSDGDNTPDNYFFVTDPNELVVQMGKVFDAISKTKSSAASVAANSATLDTGTTIYQAQFNSGVWEGDLIAIPINQDGTLGTPDWFAAAQLDGTDPNTRTIITYDPTANAGTGGGIPFRWTGASGSINTAQRAALNLNPLTSVDDGRGEDRLNYLRGVETNEQKTGNAGAIFRSRASVLGDIINSTPVFVGGPAFGYPDDIEGASNLYSTFATNYENRTPMIYAGANDGMLHAFNANPASSGGGREELGYVPNLVFSELNELTNTSYSHQFYVNGAPTVVDAFINGSWRTVLIAGLGAGGAGYFALDVTNPSGFNEANADSIALWEFDETVAPANFDTDGNGSLDIDGDLGSSFSRASLVKMQNGDWAAIFGNGYGSPRGEAALYIVNANDGSLIKKIPTGVGTPSSPNGMSSPAVVDINGDAIADYIYAGDLDGNLWKFDVTSSSVSNWESAVSSGSTPLPFFKAEIGSPAVSQPITSLPEVSANPNGPGQMIYFGTGKYFEIGDDIVTGATTQTFYGIMDINSSSPSTLTRSTLLQQTVLLETTEQFDPANPESSFDIRQISNNTIANNQDGWYLDLISPAPPTGFGEIGERVITDPIFKNGRVIFTTLIPSVAPCDAGGTGWLMELNASDGGQTPESVFDLNLDGVIDENDESSANEVVNGKRSKVGVPQKPTIIEAGEKEYKYVSGSKSASGGPQVEVTTEASGASIDGRLYWQQIQ